MSWLAPLLKLITWLGQTLFAWKAGKDDERADNAEKTIEVIERVTAPVGNDERERLWAENAAKFGGRVRGDP
jgi:hypothetical protein